MTHHNTVCSADEMGTRADIVLEMERRYGPVTDEERSRIVEAYGELERSFFRFRNKQTCFLIEWAPGTTDTLFERPDDDRNVSDSERPMIIGCRTSLIRMFSDRSIRDCLFLLQMNEDPLSSEPRQFSHDHTDGIKPAGVMAPEFTEYLFRYLLKTARGTDHDFRFTWFFDVSDISISYGGSGDWAKPLAGSSWSR